jgi:sugar lactone lactonase YvrE
MRYLRRPLCLSLSALFLWLLSLSAPSPVPASSAPAEIPPMFLTKWGSQGATEGRFFSPSSIATDARGNVFVSDRLNNRIQQFDTNGTFIRMWGWGVSSGALGFQICTANCQAGIQGDGNGQFFYPQGVAVDSLGNVYVVDSGNDRIQKFDHNGNYLLKWGTFGSSNAHFNSPRAIVVDFEGAVFVGDSVNHRVKKYLGGPTFSYTWGWGVLNGANVLQTCNFFSTCQAGIAGSGDGQFIATSGMGLDVLGNVYVADSSVHRVQKMTKSGSFLTKWGSQGSGDGQFEAPVGVAVDMNGNVYVSELTNDRIQKFDSEGTFLVKWGSSGSGDGEFDLPSGLAVDVDGNIYVVDRGNHRIQKFGSSLDFFIGEPDSLSFR